MNYVVLHTKVENCESTGDCWCDSDKLLNSETPEVVEFAHADGILDWMRRISKCRWIIDLYPHSHTIETVETLLGRKLEKDDVVIEAKEYNWWAE